MSARGSKTTDAERRALESLMAVQGDDDDDEDSHPPAGPKTQTATRSTVEDTDRYRTLSNDGADSKSSQESDAKYESSSFRRGSGSVQTQLSSSGWNDAKPTHRLANSDSGWMDAKSNTAISKDAKNLPLAAPPAQILHAHGGADEQMINDATEPDNEDEEEHALSNKGGGLVYAIAEHAPVVSVSEAKAASEARRLMALKYTDYTSDTYTSPSPASGGFEGDSNDFAIENFGKGVGLVRYVEQDHMEGVRRRLMNACSREDGVVQCYIERIRSFSGLRPVYLYRMYIEGGTGNARDDRFVMAARKLVTKTTSYYLISTEMDPSDRGSMYLLGRLRANAVGSQYLITDHGLAPDKTASDNLIRKELGVLEFQFDSGGPSRISCWLPEVGQGGTVHAWQPRDLSMSMENFIGGSAGPIANDAPSSSMTAAPRARTRSVGGSDVDLEPRLIRLANKQPRWDEAHGGHVLNFQGRVTEASVKNFQLCCLEGGPQPSDVVVLQFGRVGKNKFTLDFKYPMSPFQAFGIAVACLDGKIADRKGYEYIRKLGFGSSEVKKSAGASNNDTVAQKIGGYITNLQFTKKK